MDGINYNVVITIKIPSNLSNRLGSNLFEYMYNISSNSKRWWPKSCLYGCWTTSHSFRIVILPGMFRCDFSLNYPRFRRKHITIPPRQAKRKYSELHSVKERKAQLTLRPSLADQWSVNKIDATTYRREIHRFVCCITTTVSINQKVSKSRWGFSD